MPYFDIILRFARSRLSCCFFECSCRFCAQLEHHVGSPTANAFVHPCVWQNATHVNHSLASPPPTNGCSHPLVRHNKLQSEHNFVALSSAKPRVLHLQHQVFGSLCFLQYKHSFPGLQRRFLHSSIQHCLASP